MEQIQQKDQDSVEKTHTLFFDSQIQHETEFAFLVKCVNNKGAQSTNWIPKSKIKFILVKRRTQKPPHDFVQIKKYYAPNFFIK